MNKPDGPNLDTLDTRGERSNRPARGKASLAIARHLIDPRLVQPITTGRAPQQLSCAPKLAGETNERANILIRIVDAISPHQLRE